MIEGILYLGKEILKTLSCEEGLIENLLEKVDKEKKGKKQHIVILKIKSNIPKLEIDFKEIGDDTATDYLWVGTPTAANLPQDRLTANNIEYLISQAIPNLIKKLPEGGLKNLLVDIKSKIYFDLGEKKALSSKERQYERYRYIWDLSKLGVKDISSEKIREQVKKKNEPAKEAVKIVADILRKHIKDETGLSKNEISLYTLEVDDKVLAQNSEYKIYILESLVNKVFVDAKEGTCHLCGENAKITHNTKEFRFKFYITDKIGFSSGLGGDKTFAKNYALCKDCYKAIIAAESFIRNKLKSWLVSNVYIIPSFYLGTLIPIKEIEEWAKYLTGLFNATKNLRSWRKFQDKLDEYRDYEAQKDNFYLNFLFWEKQQAGEFKVLKLIQDVPPRRLELLMKTAGEVQEIGNKFLGEDLSWDLSLGRIFYLFPVRKAKNLIYNQKVLSFYNSIFSFLPVSYSFLIKEFVELSRVYYFEKFYEYTISSKNPDIDMCKALLSCNLLLYYLRRLKLLKGGDSMNVDELNLKQEMKEYIKEMGYSECQVALFLLGYLIGEIGNAQYKEESPKKPILEKINFQGMTKEKLKRLTPEIFEKLKIESRGKHKGLLSWSEPIFSEFKRLLDRNIEDWKLSDRENVFYILSGYAYSTYKRIRAGSTKAESALSYTFMEMAGKYEDKAEDVSEDKYKYLADAYHDE